MDKIRGSHYTILSHLIGDEARLYRLADGVWTDLADAQELPDGEGWRSGPIRQLEQLGLIEPVTKVWDSPRRITALGLDVFVRAQRYDRRGYWVLAAQS